VGKGEIVGLLGPNGAGKSTTMRILTGFLPASSGTASIAGHDVAKESLKARRHIGYMPESTPLYLNMTVKRYLAFMAAIRGVPAAERPKRVEESMAATGVTAVSGRLIKHLSKGYRQRVGLAQAIISDPEILILDEPTIGLDPTQIIEIRHLIQEMSKRRTVILSSHILPEVAEVCERVVIINQGRVIADEATSELANQLQRSQQVNVALRGDRAAIEKSLRGHPMVSSVSRRDQSAPDGVHLFVVESGVEGDLRADLARSIVGAGFDLLELSERTLTLEEIFVRLVRNESGKEAA
jgi:ABC-2 type transport system ATP-binding protein